MKIITISREFGSGGRELGKRLAEKLGIPCYDHEIIDMVAERGDCVIVGRNADVICKEMNPMKIFVYADNNSKIERCKSRAKENEHLTDKEILRNMNQIDKNRAAYHNMCTDEKWGDKSSYHLCINTSGMEIKALIPSISEYVHVWFDKE